VVRHVLCMEIGHVIAVHANGHELTSDVYEVRLYCKYGNVCSRKTTDGLF